jgi:hypothetical protein
LAAADQITGNVVRLYAVGNTLTKVEPDDRRGAGRRRILKAGIIAYNERYVTLPCMVRDISATGAHLRAEQAIGVPDTFDLIIDLDGLEASCAVVWRKDNEFGVKFLAAPRQVPPRRAQVINPLVPAQKPTLRRKPLPQTTSR